MRNVKKFIYTILVLFIAGIFAACENPFVTRILPEKGGAETGKQFTVTFDRNGGDTDAIPNTKTVKPPTKTIDTLPAAEPTWAGYIFDGWNTEADGSGVEFTATFTVATDMTVYAQWLQIPSGSFIVTFDRNGGDTDANPKVKFVMPPATTIDALPTPPVWAGHSFTRWNTQANGSGMAFTAISAVTENITVYAQWQVKPTGGDLTFYKNGVTVADVTDINELVAWLQTVGNIQDNTDYIAELHTDAVISRGFVLGNNNTGVTLLLRGDGTPRKIKMGIPSCMAYIGKGATLILENGITLRGRNNAEDGEDNIETLVKVWDGTLEMREGSEISGNVARAATEAYGGGVMVWEGTLTMKGGTIRDNSAVAGNFAYGGGVYVDNGTIAISGGTISGNTVSGGNYAYGAGISTGGIKPSTFIMSGSARVDANNDVHLYLATHAITIGGDLTANPAALISPAYAEGVLVLSGTAGLVSGNYTHFAVADDEYGNRWSITGNGTLTATYRQPRMVSGKISLSGGSGDVTQVSVQLKQNGVDVGSPVHPDANGNYAFANIAQGGDYKVEASMAGYTTQNTYTFYVSRDVIDQNLILPLILYTVQGKITLSGGTGTVQNTAVQLRQGGGNIGTVVNPNQNGDYTIHNVPPGSDYAIYASLAGYSTAQSATPFTLVNANVASQNLSLTWIPQTYSVSGTISGITIYSASLYGDGVRVRLAQNGNDLGGAQITPNSDGTYTIPRIPDGTNYTVKVLVESEVVAAGTPFSVSYGNVAGQDFSITPYTWVDRDNPAGTFAFTGLASALRWVRNNSAHNTNYTVRLGRNEAINNAGFSAYTSEPMNVGIILKGEGGTREISPSDTGSGELFGIGYGFTLTLDSGITLKGRSDKPNSLVTIVGGGGVVMKSGATITGSFPTYGSVVYIRRDYNFNDLPVPFFIMEGGTITGNKGGIRIDDGNGSFTMNGGSITDNQGGGVYLNNPGTSFTMNDGTISNNMNTGVAVGGGTFTMNGGSITGNTGRYGGGVKNAGIFTMKGGTISNNRAEYGAGVYVGYGEPNYTYHSSNGIFEMQGGEISGNIASVYGGGIFIWSGFESWWYNNSLIMYKETSSAQQFTKTGGTITGNTVSTGTNRGAQVLAQQYEGKVTSDNPEGTSGSISQILTILGRRETAAGPSANITYTFQGHTLLSSSGWDY